jgi:hypothetical protein
MVNEETLAHWGLSYQKQTLFQDFAVLLTAYLNVTVISKLFALPWNSVFSVPFYVWEKFCDIY